jgi:hypothetical protein
MAYQENQQKDISRQNVVKDSAETSRLARARALADFPHPSPAPAGSLGEGMRHPLSSPSLLPAGFRGGFLIPALG